MLYKPLRSTYVAKIIENYVSMGVWHSFKHRFLPKNYLFSKPWLRFRHASKDLCYNRVIYWITSWDNISRSILVALPHSQVYPFKSYSQMQHFISSATYKNVALAHLSKLCSLKCRCKVILKYGHYNALSKIVKKFALLLFVSNLYRNIFN